MNQNLVDIQNNTDIRKIAIDQVGVRNITYPVTIIERNNQPQQTVGTVNLTVDLPHHFKGTHMSRFLEVLNEHHENITAENIHQILYSLRERLQADKSYIEIKFPYFISKKAPVTEQVGNMVYTCGFSAGHHKESEKNFFHLLCEVMVTTLCPCSREISDRGAHNQRGVVTTCLSIKGEVRFEEIIDMIESSASCELYSVLKRPDEKFVTEQAYDNPRFVEDLVREVALKFDADPRIQTYKIEVENHESIHAHNAYAYVCNGM